MSCITTTIIGIHPLQNNAGGYGTGSYGPAQRRKRSGASQKTISKGKYQGKPCVTGWNFRKGQGLISVFCGPYKKTKRGKSKAGKRYETWIAKLYNKTTHQQQNTTLHVFILTKERLLSIRWNGW